MAIVHGAFYKNVSGRGSRRHSSLLVQLLSREIVSAVVAVRKTNRELRDINKSARPSEGHDDVWSRKRRLIFPRDPDDFRQNSLCRWSHATVVVVDVIFSYARAIIYGI